jgi:translation initiation factor 1
MHKPFAELARLRGKTDEPPAPDAAAAPAAPPAAPSAVPAVPATPASRTIPRAVVRVERAGRGGKEVTVIEQLDLSAAERDAWLKALKSTLGCGGVVEDATLVLQGDHRKRLPSMLAARGVKKVIAG